jgi:hypothetical protein
VSVVTPCLTVLDLADGQQITVQGSCNVRLQIGPYKAIIKCWVTALHPAYDVILGRTWIRQSKAILNGEDNTLSVATAKGRLTLSSQQSTSTQQDQEPRIRLLTVQQANIAVRKQPTMLIFVNEVKEHNNIQATTSNGLIDKHDSSQQLSGRAQ